MVTSGQAHGGDETFSFGPFVLVPGQRLLTCLGQPVRLGARAFDILVALVEQAGQPVSKDRLVALVWPHTLVEESNLRVHIAALRKLFQAQVGGERYIVNIAGLGYLFSAAVMRGHGVPVARDACGMTDLFGRDDVIASILERMSDRRLITITGPAGVGKSRVAKAVADAVGMGRGAPVACVDLSLLEDAAQLSGAVADMPDSGLLVLDTCEHLLDRVADLAEALLQARPGLTLLATSHEPLGCREEWVCRLAPLAVPAIEPGLTAARAMAFPAVQLFVARAQGFPFGDAQAVPVAALCAHLDGVPLAIERVAARLDLVGLGAPQSVLEERLMLSLRQGRGEGRQVSMRAALDWSYARLSRVEQAVLQCLSALRGAFSLQRAVEAGARGGIAQGDVLDALASLTARSLVATMGGTVTMYRLFHVTRSYAAEKLEAAQGAQRMDPPLEGSVVIRLDDVLRRPGDRHDDNGGKALSARFS